MGSFFWYETSCPPLKQRFLKPDDISFYDRISNNDAKVRVPHAPHQRAGRLLQTTRDRTGPEDGRLSDEADFLIRYIPAKSDGKLGGAELRRGR